MGDSFDATHLSPGSGSAYGSRAEGGRRKSQTQPAADLECCECDTTTGCPNFGIVRHQRRREFDYFCILPRDFKRTGRTQITNSTRS